MDSSLVRGVAALDAPVEPASASPAWTAGPWEAGTPGNGAPGYIYSDDKTGSAIAQCALEWVDRPGSEIEANARLIAAAPELYAALDRLSIMLPSEQPAAPQDERIPAGFCYVRWSDVALAKAALRKATTG